MTALRRSEQAMFACARPTDTNRLRLRLILILAVGNLADWLTTWWALNNGAIEANPHMNALIAAGGIGAFLLVKLVLSIVVPAFGLTLPLARRCLSRRTIYAIAVIFTTAPAYLAVNNAGIALGLWPALLPGAQPIVVGI